MDNSGYDEFGEDSIDCKTIYLYNLYKSIPYGRNIFGRLNITSPSIIYNHISNPNLEDDAYNPKYITLIKTMDPTFSLVDLYKKIKERVELSLTLDRDIRDWLLSNEYNISRISYDGYVGNVYIYTPSSNKPIMKYREQTLESYKAIVYTIYYGNRPDIYKKYISHLII